MGNDPGRIIYQCDDFIEYESELDDPCSAWDFQDDPLACRPKAADGRLGDSDDDNAMKPDSYPAPKQAGPGVTNQHREDETSDIEVSGELFTEGEGGESQYNEIDESLLNWDRYATRNGRVNAAGGAIAGRNWPHTFRLATAFAKLDMSEVVALAHLDAGRAIIDYSNRCIRYIFEGDESWGDANKLHARLPSAGADGATRTMISNCFGNGP